MRIESSQALDTVNSATRYKDTRATQANVMLPPHAMECRPLTGVRHAKWHSRDGGIGNGMVTAELAFIWAERQLRSPVLRSNRFETPSPKPRSLPIWQSNRCNPPRSLRQALRSSQRTTKLRRFLGVPSRHHNPPLWLLGNAFQVELIWTLSQSGPQAQR